MTPDIIVDVAHLKHLVGRGNAIARLAFVFEPNDTGTGMTMEPGDVAFKCNFATIVCTRMLIDKGSG